MSEWTEVKEPAETPAATPAATSDATPPVEPAPPSEGLKNFIAETKELFDKLPAEVKPAAATPATPKLPVIDDPAAGKPKEDSGFIPDWDKATPEQLKKRIGYLYAKTKEGERLWAEAREFQQKQMAEVERLRADQKKRDLALTERELDAEQLRVIDLLDRNSPNYNAADGAKALRELTQRDNALKQEREAEVTRQETVKAEIEKSSHEAVIIESKRIIDDWAVGRDYAQPGHPLYNHLQAWLKKAYDTAPEHVTVADIVKKAEQVFDAHVKRMAPGATAQPAQPAAKPNGDRAPGAGGERLTVSQVLGSQAPRGQPADPGAKLSQQQRTVAERLFYDPEKGVTKAKAYAMYAEGLGG